MSRLCALNCKALLCKDYSPNCKELLCNGCVSQVVKNCYVKAVVWKEMCKGCIPSCKELWVDDGVSGGGDSCL